MRTPDTQEALKVKRQLIDPTPNTRNMEFHLLLTFRLLFQDLWKLLSMVQQGRRFKRRLKTIYSARRQVEILTVSIESMQFSVKGTPTQWHIIAAIKVPNQLIPTPGTIHQVVGRIMQLLKVLAIRGRQLDLIHHT
jgi:hypothetical protein